MRAFSLAFSVLTLAAGAARAASPEPSSTALFAAAYAGRAAGDAGLSWRPGQGLVRWSLGDNRALAPTGGLRVATASLEANPIAALLRPSPPAGVGADAYELTYVRNWPAAVNVQKGRLNLDITPHAGLGLSSAGAQIAEVGAMLRLGARLMDAIGADDAVRGSRLYLFAGANRRATGLNLLQSQTVRAKLNAGGVGEGVVRQAEAGLGFRQGAVSASLGYSYERTRLKALAGDAYGFDRFGINLSIRP
jgi:hypothetical protein